MNKSLLKTGVIGASVMAICCFTPVLVFIFVGLGISALLVYLDYFLLPLLAVFLLLIVAALMMKRQKNG